MARIRLRRGGLVAAAAAQSIEGEGSVVTAEGREMRSVMGMRGWAETAGAFLSASALVLLLVRPDWIEALLGVDPDQGSGALEAVIAVLALCATVTFSLMARWEWRRARARNSTAPA